MTVFLPWCKLCHLNKTSTKGALNAQVLDFCIPVTPPTMVALTQYMATSGGGSESADASVAAGVGTPPTPGAGQ
jgi:hypothetical protein